VEEDLLSLLKACKIFASLNKQATQKLLTKLDKVTLDQGEVLFCQGDISDSLYLLARGELSAMLTTASGDNRTISYIEPGETVGELGALSSAPRTLTIKAAKPSVLFRLATQDFITLCHQYPKVMLEAINPIILRSQKVLSLLSSEEKSKKQIVIMPANKKVILDKFADQLAKYTQKLTSIIFLSDYDLAINELDTAELAEKIKLIEKNKKAKQVILYLLKSTHTPLAEVALKKMEMLYVVGVPHVEHVFDNGVLNAIKKYHLHFKVGPQFVLLHLKKTVLPHKTSHWLKQADFSLAHHVRINTGNDYRRLLRFVRGRAVGVVLGGGGTRGFGHLGAIKALRESKIPIDIIGGTSAGAIVGGCYAMTQSYAGAFEKFEAIAQASKRSVSWRSLTWPIISLFNAKKFTEAQKKAFNSTRIEDLWLPYFCISCNLAENTEQVHFSGHLWKKTRASSAIPGLIPPMVLDGQVHFDGSLLNNLPVDVMRHIVGIKGRIIAIELGINQKDEDFYKFPPIITFWQTLLSKLGLRPNGLRVPRFVDTFLQSLFVGSLLKSRQNGLAANLLISLDLAKFGFLHVDDHEAAEIIEVGYQETLKQVKKLRPNNKR
jgi:NTE family protein